MKRKKCNNCTKSLPENKKYFHKSKNGFRAICIECHKQKCKKYYKKNKNKFIEYREKNKDKILKRKKEYRKTHKKEIAKYKYWYHKKRYHNDIQYRLLHNCGVRIRKHLKENKDKIRSVELIGCTISELKEHLEKQFDHKMSWENYGLYWHIDHIIPCASFDFTNLEQQKQCFHYTNLQPLEAKENIRKGNKIR
jgi:hypothetical protein